MCPPILNKLVQRIFLLGFKARPDYKMVREGLKQIHKLLLDDQLQIPKHVPRKR